MPFSKSAHHLIGDLHNWVGWTIIVVAAGHAGAALFHYLMLHDDRAVVNAAGAMRKAARGAGTLSRITKTVVMALFPAEIVGLGRDQAAWSGPASMSWIRADMYEALAIVLQNSSCAQLS